MTSPRRGAMLTILAMSKDSASKNWLLAFFITLVTALLFFWLLCAILFRLFPWPTSAADFGQAISGISAPFTALAFAGALYAVFLQRKP
jgi:nicotinamide riboside transporter PnuC